MDDDATAPTAAELGAQIRLTVGQLQRRFRSERPDGDLGDATLEVLTRLFKDGPRSLTALSDHFRVSPASMSQTVNRLTTGGYAVRAPDPDDRRRVLFSTTPAGDRLAGAARAQRNAWLDEQLAALGPDDRSVLERAAALLGRMAAS
ncbi:hypothetical protein AX769_07425 [Frondihabitans sp. PAMC 28766]|uniref:MarR family winged helix-turn-helix transcriptional regulator n=1 Tax=Frondihabitans sp. PAMC 28766 TaxID=1795630 RepID=UPI00078D5FAA|nr:MarR family transcriptional regulator [Frondihabitans sp. PAMC 28766]AMM20027.1 hypothetical protein AX769_07425 [Frondihabitans sp. PAMC 28766]